jgi:hypothetical protein
MFVYRVKYRPRPHAQGFQTLHSACARRPVGGDSESLLEHNSFLSTSLKGQILYTFLALNMRVSLSEKKLFLQLTIII